MANGEAVNLDKLPAELLKIFLDDDPELSRL